MEIQYKANDVVCGIKVATNLPRKDYYDSIYCLH